MIKAVRCSWFASLKYSFIFGSCDIGLAVLDSGQEVYITWGRGVDLESRTSFSKVLLPTTLEDGKECFEYIIPHEIISDLRHKGMFSF